MTKDTKNFIYSISALLISIITACIVVYHMNCSGFYIGTFLDQYWDRIIILSGIVFFFIRELYKLRLKKEEIRYTLYYSKTINSIQDYINTYEEYKKAMNNLPFDVFKGEIQGTELDNIITRNLNRIKQADSILRIFLEEELYNKYKEITEESIKLIDRLSSILQDVHITEKEKHDIAVKRNGIYIIAYTKYAEDTKYMLSEVLKATRVKIQ